MAGVKKGRSGERGGDGRGGEDETGIKETRLNVMEGECREDGSAGGASEDIILLS